VRVAPYATFGTPELATAVRSALEGRTAALMANHGSVAVGGSLDEALDRALLLEWLCRLYLDASVVGAPATLDQAQQDAVVEAAVGRRYGTTRPAAPSPEAP
jgi:L-fuculose-phosphate aldolase